MVSPVNFRATSASSFQEMLRKPQAYTQQPAASTSIEGEKKKGKAGKTILGLALAATAIAGGMVAVNKYNSQINKFIKTKIKNEKVAAFAKTATQKIGGWGKAISTKATEAVAFVKEKGSKLISKTNSQNVAEEVIEVAEEAIETVVS